MNDDYQYLLAEAEMGEHAQKWVESQIGQYVLGCAHEEIESLRTQLETETDIDKIRQHQMAIASRRHTVRWLTTAIKAGNVAMETIETGNSED